MNKLVISVIFFALTLGLSAQENEMVRSNVIEIHTGGKVLRGPSVEYRGGKVHLSLGEQGTTGYDIDKIQKIVSPMPSNLRKMMNAFYAGRYELVAGKAGLSVVEELRFLGWGKRAAFAYGYSLIKIGKPKEGQPVIRRAAGYVRGSDEALDRQLLSLASASAELANNKDSAAKSEIAKVVKDLLPEAKPIYYNIEGDLYSKAGDENQAVLSYYKTLLLDQTNPYERHYAKEKIQAIYKKLNDPRADKIKSLN
ncbi:MAG: hypothetical protein NE327_01735 [Lentisphaeraceae bacterium]|nr:hypothetical protein [Lentisphaeraceae bacterium]